MAQQGLGADKTDKQLSSKISRYFRLLRVHGIIKKLPKQNRYQLTIKGLRLTNILNAHLAASTEKLMKLAA
jgi:DNA-binding IclR family transcriptional regulator